MSDKKNSNGLRRRNVKPASPGNDSIIHYESVDSSSEPEMDIVLEEKRGISVPPAPPVSQWRKILHSHLNSPQNPTPILPTAAADYEKNQCFMPFPPQTWITTLALLSSSTTIWIVVAIFGYRMSVLFAGFALQVYLLTFWAINTFTPPFDIEKHYDIVMRDPLQLSEDAPTVDVFICTAARGAEECANACSYLSKLAYPADKLRVHMLDDGDQPRMKVVAEKYGFHHVVRGNRGEWKKAGNLRWGFARTEGEFFAIFDGDFCPRHDFLKETVPLMKADPKVAIVQTPQYFRTVQGQTWIEKGANALQAPFYKFDQVARNTFDGARCAGSNALLRRSAFLETGGTALAGGQEDLNTGWSAHSRGWKLAYVPLNLACGVSPDTTRSYFNQQTRWCFGGLELLMSRRFWMEGKLSFMQRICYVLVMLDWSSNPLRLFLKPLAGLLILSFGRSYLRLYICLSILPFLISSALDASVWGLRTIIYRHQTEVIQQFASLSAWYEILTGGTNVWIPSGDRSAHQSTKTKYDKYHSLAKYWFGVVTVSFLIACFVLVSIGASRGGVSVVVILHLTQICTALPFLLAP